MRRRYYTDYGYRTAIFSAIELSEYRISYWPIQRTIVLSDIRSGPRSIGLSDIGLRKKLAVVHLCLFDLCEEWFRFSFK